MLERKDKKQKDFSKQIHTDATLHRKLFSRRVNKHKQRLQTGHEALTIKLRVLARLSLKYMQAFSDCL